MRAVFSEGKDQYSSTESVTEKKFHIPALSSLSPGNYELVWSLTVIKRFIILLPLALYHKRSVEVLKKKRKKVVSKLSQNGGSVDKICMDYFAEKRRR